MDGDEPQQPIEDVLASIKRIISHDVEAARQAPRGPAASRIAADEDVLELGEAPAAPPAPATAPAPEPLISGDTARASKAALAALAEVRVDPRAGDNTLDGLVRDLLRPMLKEWLDAHLPEVVERIVAREVGRIMGR